MPVTQTKPGPYAPASAILDVVSRYRNRGLPTPVTGEVLARAGISDSLIPRSLQALQTLDLIDKDGAPTPTLEGLRLAPEPEFRERLADWLRSAYADAFAFVDPAKDDATRIRDAFRSYQPIGQQDRMVSLFQGLCAAAGLMPEKAAKPAAAAGSARPAPPRAPAGTPRQQTAAKRVLATRIKNHNEVHGSAHGLPSALAGLLASLPAEGGNWTKSERDKFVRTFEAVIDFCFEIDNAPPASGLPS